jgi:acyl carrier protein
MKAHFPKPRPLDRPRLDSLTLVEITVLLENEFGVNLEEEEYSSFTRLGIS